MFNEALIFVHRQGIDQPEIYKIKTRLDLNIIGDRILRDDVEGLCKQLNIILDERDYLEMIPFLTLDSITLKDWD